jgi:hypothetical protein
VTFCRDGQVALKFVDAGEENALRLFLLQKVAYLSEGSQVSGGGDDDDNDNDNDQGGEGSEEEEKGRRG